jgi:hypothetical protein
MGEERKLYKIVAVKPKGKAPLEDQGVDGRIESEWILGGIGLGGVDWI